MSRSSSELVRGTVVFFEAWGSLSLVLSYLPVGADFRGLLLCFTMGGAVSLTSYAAGLGFYGLIRYPSRRLILPAVMAVMVAALSYRRLMLT